MFYTLSKRVTSSTRSDSCWAQDILALCVVTCKLYCALANLYTANNDYKAHIGINNGLDNEACHLHVTVRWMAGEPLQLDPNACSNSEEGINAGILWILMQGGTWTHDLANGLPCSNQLSYRVTQKFDFLLYYHLQLIIWHVYFISDLVDTVITAWEVVHTSATFVQVFTIFYKKYGENSLYIYEKVSSDKLLNITPENTNYS